MIDAPVLEVSDLTMRYPLGRGATVHAVSGVSFTIAPGEVLGLVGESGSGKTTVGKCVVRLLEPTSGRIVLGGTDITHLSRSRLRPHRRQMHMVFQDPYSSLNPRMTNREIVGEPVRRHGLAKGSELDDQVAALFEKVGLSADLRHRYPHELSGGQRQRVGLARSLILQPKVLVADEPLSALDVSVQASIINLLIDLQQEMGFSALLITHDLAAVKVVTDRIAVMYLGKIVELGSSDELFADPKHPYTQALISAAVVPDPVAQRARRRVLLDGDLPSASDPPPGCPFHPRCPVAEDRCRVDAPELRPVGAPHRSVSCHLVGADGNAPRLVDHRG